MTPLFLQRKKQETSDFVKLSPENLQRAISLASECLKTHQHRDGYFWYTLEANDTINAETILLMRYLKLNDEKTERALGRWLLRNQHPDGSWGLYYGGAGDLSATAECYFALKWIGEATDSPSLMKARDFILKNGGITKVRIFTRIHLALFGLVGWKTCPQMPVGLIQLPDWSPVNIYEFSSWARASIVPLLVVMDQQKPVSPPFDLNELYVEKDPKVASWDYESDRRFLSIENIFLYVDKALKVADRLKLKPLRKSSLKKCENYIRSHLEGTQDIFPALFYGILALHSLGFSLDDPHIQTALDGLKAFRIPIDPDSNLPALPFIHYEPPSLLYQQCCISPVWDTAWAGLALLEAGERADHEKILQAARWLLAKQVTTKGDWAVKNPNAKPGGWSFEFLNNHYPDIDDTIEVLTFLYQSGLTFRELNKAFQLGLDWLLSMQCSNGGFAAFDKNNNFELLNKIPFSDHGACLDPPTVDVTGRVIEFLITVCDFDPNSAIIQRAADFLIKHQEKDGSFWGRWGVNYIYGTWCALGGLCALNRPQDQLAIGRAVKWLKSVQNEDGGFGETCHSYAEDRYLPLGKSLPSQTAWALMAFISAGEAESEAAKKAVAFLVDTQLPSGGFDEKYHTGAGFPGHFYIRYHGYRYYFPLLALARFQKQYKKTV